MQTSFQLLTKQIKHFKSLKNCNRQISKKKNNLKSRLCMSAKKISIGFIWNRLCWRDPLLVSEWSLCWGRKGSPWRGSPKWPGWRQCGRPTRTSPAQQPEIKHAFVYLHICRIYFGSLRRLPIFYMPQQPQVQRNIWPQPLNNTFCVQISGSSCQVQKRQLFGW